MPVKAALSAWLGRFYRLSYNLFAAAHVVLTWLLAEHWLGRAGQIFDRPAGLEIAQTAGFALGAVLMVVGLRGYDLGRLAGTAQLAAGSAGQDLRVDEPLRTDGLHRYMRHPLYSAGFLLLWGRVTGEATLATALWLSLYLLIGTWLEERRLLQAYGDAYADYRARVPAFLPWRGRAL
ncbi:MAG: methyltransferase [Alphaproteobacteria bacterium]|nr:methyltransferase [Alphaproteobacteria bacterium]